MKINKFSSFVENDSFETLFYIDLQKFQYFIKFDFYLYFFIFFNIF